MFLEIVSGNRCFYSGLVCFFDDPSHNTPFLPFIRLSTLVLGEYKKYGATHKVLRDLPKLRMLL